jgi:LPS sulfotransferase NodH
LRRRLERPEPFAREIIEASFRWDGVLFIKTHAHSMHHMNRDDDGRLVHPHCYGPTRDLYGAIFEAAGVAGATVTLATAGEVYDRFVEAPSSAERPPMSAFRPSLAGRALSHVEPTSERVLETAAELDGIAVATLTARIAELGVDGSGAEAHYASLVERGSLLPKHDLRAAQILLSQFAARHTVHEIGCGVGMLPLLLAALGVPALGIEHSQRRYDASRAIAATVARDRPTPLSQHDFLLGRFPECIDREDLSDKVAVITDFTCTMTAEERQELMWALRGYGAVLLDLDRFVRRIGSPEERQELIAEFRRLGFAAIYDAEISADFAFVLMVSNEQLLGPASAPTPPAAGPAAVPAKRRPEGIPASGDAALDGIFALPLSRHRCTQDPQNAACTRSLRTLRRRILIVAPSRTGSEYFSSLLASQGIDCEEYFNPRSAVSRGRSIDEGQSPAEFIITLCQRLPNRIFCTKEGVHSLMPLFEVGELPEHIADWHFIYLTRRNIVRQAISLLLAEETGQWRHDIEPISALRPDVLSFAAVARRIKEIFVARDLAQRFFTVFDIDPLEICYEDLIVSPRECLARFVEFVGLTPLAAGNAPSADRSDRPRAQSTELNRKLETAFRAELHRRVSGRDSSNDLLLEEESLLSDNGTAGSAAAPLAGASSEGLISQARAMPTYAKRIALPGPFEQEIGFCWISRLNTLPEAAELEGVADHDGAHMRSTACLCEDAGALGPAHSAHAEIRRVGGGAFSHWRDRLYFSTSDNSDPNLNGRAYYLQLGSSSPERETASTMVKQDSFWEDSADSIHDHGHRESVGGMWEEIGRLQFEFVRRQCLKPDDILVDVACGALRGGVHFVRYLDKGHYLGIDKRIELIIYGVAAELGLDDYKLKRPRFVISDKFEFDRFDLRPSFAVAQSLFTHLVPDDIVLCLRNLRNQAADGCRLFATFREVNDPQQNLPDSHAHAVYSYTQEEMAKFAADAGWDFTYIGDWGHPRGQCIAEFRQRPQR